MKYDDGAVIYLNGVEVQRANMRTDLVVDNETPAFGNANAEGTWKVSCTPPTHCKTGILFISNLLSCFLAHLTDR
jgi:hypothetical protein